MDYLRGSLTRAFAKEHGPNFPDAYLRRPPVSQRAEIDYSGETMARYIGGLQFRLLTHVEKHAQRWHAQEMRRVLERWHKPSASHPAPNWAARRDMVREARDYAAALVQERLAAKLLRFHNLAVVRALEQGEKGPLLREIFRRADESLQKNFKHKR